MIEGLPIEEAKKLLNFLEKMNWDLIRINGNEITLRRDIRKREGGK